MICTQCMRHTQIEGRDWCNVFDEPRRLSADDCYKDAPCDRGKIELKVKGSCFLELDDRVEDIEAAFRIVKELHERGMIEVKIDRNFSEPFVSWTLKVREDDAI